MNSSRAQQIIDSPKEIQVLYNGTPVWLQSVDEAHQTVRCYTANKPDDEMVVSVMDLNEQ